MDNFTLSRPSDTARTEEFLRGLRDDRNEGLKQAVAVNAAVFATILGYHAFKNRRGKK